MTAFNDIHNITGVREPLPSFLPFPNFDSIHRKYSQKCFYAGWRGLQCKYNRMKCPCVHKYRFPLSFEWRKTYLRLYKL